jgi:hypothetical protein
MVATIRACTIIGKQEGQSKECSHVTPRTHPSACTRKIRKTRLAPVLTSPRKRMRRAYAAKQPFLWGLLRRRSLATPWRRRRDWQCVFMSKMLPRCRGDGQAAQGKKASARTSPGLRPPSPTRGGARLTERISGAGPARLPTTGSDAHPPFLREGVEERRTRVGQCPSPRRGGGRGRGLWLSGQRERGDQPVARGGRESSGRRRAWPTHQRLRRRDRRKSGGCRCSPAVRSGR